MIPFARRKRRNRDFRPRGATAPPALALVGVDGLSVVGADIEMNVVFNITGGDALADVGAADPTKWSARYQGQRYVGTLLSNILPDTLYLSMSPTGAEAGADELSYANAPSDIADTLGRTLGAFSGFAL